ncbi:MAG: DUF1810 domain-containing protein [Proteobacteria bacterium]|nr:DUF1810 domain-containing protein [Pseudomonadota bacterium]
MTRRFDLERFVAAQDPIYAAVSAELRAGRKQSHWMWFIFPQIAGLGASEMARRYAIGSLDEARAYLADTVLGQRLRECTALVLGAKDKNADDIFGYPDSLKFHSCMTLFVHAAPEDTETVFHDALERFFDGKENEKTMAWLEENKKNPARWA